VVSYLKPKIAQTIITRAISDIEDVTKPTFFERSHPLNPILARSINILTKNAKELITLAVFITSSLFKLGESGCTIVPTITKLITPMTKPHEDKAVELTIQFVMRFEESATKKVTKNVAAKPPKKADKNANWLANSIR